MKSDETNENGIKRNVRICFVIPAYNVECYIDQAMTSVLTQDPSPHEVIVIDDGSTDGTARKLQRYLSNPIVRIISRENGGLGSARNLGLSLCTGEFVFFMDSDDLIPPIFMKRISTVLHDNDYPDMVLFSASSFSDQEILCDPSPKFSRKFSARFPESGSLLRELTDACCLHAAAWLYVSRVQLWIKNQISFPSIIHEDEAVLFPLVTSATSAVVIQDSLYLYRIRPGSIMTSGLSPRSTIAALEITKGFLQRIREKDFVKDPDVDLWRWKGAYWANVYFRYSRIFQTQIDWGTALKAIIILRRADVLWEILCSLLPRRIYNVFRNYAHRYRSSERSQGAEPDSQ